MSFKSTEDQVEKLLDMLPQNGASFFMVIKKTQVGFTTSLIKKSIEKGLKITVIEPTNKIIDDTVAKAASNFIKIGRNDVMCSLAQPDPLFGWENRGNCNFCQENCRYKDVLNDKASNLALTYHKLLALASASKAEFEANMNGQVDTPQALLASGLMEIILQRDVILLDEIPTTLTHYTGFNADIADQTFKNLSNCKMTPTEYKAFEQLSAYFNAIISHAVDTAFNNPNILELKQAKELGLALIKLVPDSAKNDFKNFLLSLTHNELIIFTTKKNKMVQVKQHTFMRKLLDEIAIWGFKGKVFITGAKMPDIKDFKNFTEVVMPDFNKTEKSRLVVIDKADWNFETKWYREKGKVKAILKALTDSMKGEKVLVIAINKKIAENIKSWSLLGVDTEEYLYYTYYRSEDSMGVRLPYRVVVCVGMPWTPQDSHKGHDLIYGEPPGTFRDIERKDTLINALGRGKDPEGKERSIVFMLGTTLSDFKNDYPDKIEVVETVKRGTLHRAASSIAFLWLRHGAKYEDFQDLPKIADVLRTSTPGHTYHLGSFAYQRLKMKADDFIQFFNKYAYLFPTHWRIEKRGQNGHTLHT